MVVIRFFLLAIINIKKEIFTAPSAQLLSFLRMKTKGTCGALLSLFNLSVCNLHLGLIKKILAATFWIPLSHINYAAYIVHYDVVKGLMYNIETPIHYTTFTLVRPAW